MLTAEPEGEVATADSSSLEAYDEADETVDRGADGGSKDLAAGAPMAMAPNSSMNACTTHYTLRLLKFNSK